MRHRWTHAFSILLSALLVAGTLAGCDSMDGGGGEGALRSISYALTAQSNDSAAPEGVNAVATFWELGPDRTLVTLELNSAMPDGVVGLVAHIHANSASDGGGIQFFLSPIDVVGGGGTSAKLINRSYNELVELDGHINVYEGSANALVAQGDIGANADGERGAGLDRVAEGATVTYDLAAHPNEGSLAEGVAGVARFIELTPTQTLVQLQLDDGPTGALLTHPAHIHTNSASEGGDIAIYLSPIDGNGNPANDGAASKIVDRPYDELTAFDGHINIHQSYNSIQYVIAQGNIGANGEGQ
jgi:hypothetical protein